MPRWRAAPLYSDGPGQLQVGQVVRYRYYDQTEPRHKLGVVTKQLGSFPATGQPHDEISCSAPVQHPPFAAEKATVFLSSTRAGG